MDLGSYEVSAPRQIVLKLLKLRNAGARTDNALRSVVPWPKKKQTPWSQSASELYRPSDRRLSAK
jgi:hypothetical protein